MYWLGNDEGLRAYSAYEAFGYAYSVVVFDRRVTETTGKEREYWVRVREALDRVAG